MKCPLPECGGELRPHCPTTTSRAHPTCTWLKCTRCKTRIEPAKRRGFTQLTDLSGSTAFTY